LKPQDRAHAAGVAQRGRAREQENQKAPAKTRGAAKGKVE
jgi:hypothetical protein